MKRIHPDEPRVTAHALGELPEPEAAEVERAVQTEPAVKAAVEETHALASLIRAGYRAESHELGEARREAIRRAGRRPTPENLVSLDPRRRWWRPAAVTGAAACLVAGAVWMMQQVPVGDDGMTAWEREAQQREELRSEALLMPAPRPGRIGDTLPGARPGPRSSLFEGEEELPAEVVEEEYSALRRLRQMDPEAYLERVDDVARTAALPLLAKLPPLTDNPFIPCREAARSAVPLVSGSASYPLVERFVRNEGKLPPPNAVRIEELINHLTYEDAGDADLDGIRMGAELVRCPWDRGAILMGVLLRNGSDRPISRDAVLQVEFKPDPIRSYRLIGYARVSGEGLEGTLGSEGLAPGKSNFVLYQIEPLDHEIFLRHLVVARVGLRLGDENQPGLVVPVTSPPRDWVNASNNVQSATALGAWGMMLRKSPYRGRISPRLVRELAEDARATVPEGDLARREAMQLILDSLALVPEEAGAVSGEMAP